MANERTAARGEVRHIRGAVRMDDFPLLTYGPISGDPKVRVARTGRAVEEILAYDRDHPDLPGSGIRGLFDLTAEEWEEIVRWDGLSEESPGR